MLREDKYKDDTVVFQGNQSMAPTAHLCEIPYLIKYFTKLTKFGLQSSNNPI